MNNNEIYVLLTNYKSRISNLDDVPDELKSICGELMEVLNSSTLDEVISSSKTVAKHFGESLHNIIRGDITRANVDHILGIIASFFYESMINNKGIESGAPKKLLTKYAGPQPDNDEQRFLYSSLFPRVSLLCMSDMYQKFTLDMSTQKKEIEDCVKFTADKVKENIDVLSNTDAQLKIYVEKATNLRSQLNFLVLSKAFTTFIEENERRKMFLLYWLIALGVLLILLPMYGFYHNSDSSIQNINSAITSVQSTYSSEHNSSYKQSLVNRNALPLLDDKLAKRIIGWPDIINRLLNYLPITVAVIILLFYFRIVLSHYNSANAQWLQLKMRQSVCQFIEEYVKFKKNADTNDLDKFESLLFSNLMPSAEQIPPTFEGLDHLGKILSEFKPKT
jgi:hypothetical protein